MKKQEHKTHIHVEDEFLQQTELRCCFMGPAGGRQGGCGLPGGPQRPPRQRPSTRGPGLLGSMSSSSTYRKQSQQETGHRLTMTRPPSLLEDTSAVLSVHFTYSLL